MKGFIDRHFEFLYERKDILMFLFREAVCKIISEDGYKKKALALAEQIGGTDGRKECARVIWDKINEIQGLNLFS